MEKEYRTDMQTDIFNFGLRGSGNVYFRQKPAFDLFHQIKNFLTAYPPRQVKIARIVEKRLGSVPRQRTGV